MTHDMETTLQSIARESVEQLFSDYGLALRAQQVLPDTKQEFFLCGIIGFTGRMLRGSVMIAAGRDLLEACAPPQTSLRDWIAELSNQLLGRIKRQLLARGVTIQMCTPAVLRGERLSPMLPDEHLPVLFACDRGALSVCVEVEALQSVTLDVKTTNDLAAEGSAVLF